MSKAELELGDVVSVTILSRWENVIAKCVGDTWDGDGKTFVILLGKPDNNCPAGFWLSHAQINEFCSFLTRIEE